MIFTDAFGRTDTWTMEGIQRCVGPGWTPLLNSLVTDLFDLGWDGCLDQVKEKYGGLRFYIGGSTDEIFDRIDKAETDSLKICETCGKPGKLWTGWWWLITHCEECNKKRWEETKDRLVGTEGKTYEEWASKSIGPEEF